MYATASESSVVDIRTTNSNIRSHDGSWSINDLSISTQQDIFSPHGYADDPIRAFKQEPNLAIFINIPVPGHEQKAH